MKINFKSIIKKKWFIPVLIFIVLILIYLVLYISGALKSDVVQSNSIVSKENFDLLEKGMRKEQVLNILGDRYSVESEYVDGISIEAYTFENFNYLTFIYTTVIVFFVDDILESKYIIRA